MDPLPPPSAAPAGWYPDPATGGRRYFDGVKWVSPEAGGAGFVLEHRDEHPTLPVAAAVGAVAILVASLVLTKALIDALVGRSWPLVTYIAISAIGSYGPSLAWLMVVRRRWGGGRFAAIGWRFRWADLGWGPLTWVAAVGTQIGVAVLVLVLDVPLSSNVESISDADADRAYVVATAIAAVVAAPVVEELVFRGLVLRGLLSRVGPVVAVVVQGVLFGVAHVDPARGAGNLGLAMVLSGVGIALGTGAFLARRLGPSVIAHAIFNAVVLTILLSGVLDGVGRDPFASSAGSPAAGGPVPTVGSAELEVVDQPDVPESSGRQHHDRPIDLLHGDQGVGIDEIHVLEVSEGFAGDPVRGEGTQSAGVAFAGGPRVPGLAQGA
jgi:membrane protease YdiL (CAAX protease family)